MVTTSHQLYDNNIYLETKKFVCLIFIALAEYMSFYLFPQDDQVITINVQQFRTKNA